MALTATLEQTRKLTELSDESIKKLIREKRLHRLTSTWCVRISCQSIAAYLHVPLEAVVMECRKFPVRVRKAAKRGMKGQLAFPFFATVPTKKPPTLKLKRTGWPRANDVPDRDAKPPEAPEAPDAQT